MGFIQVKITKRNAILYLETSCNFMRLGVRPCRGLCKSNILIFIKKSYTQNLLTPSISKLQKKLLS